MPVYEALMIMGESIVFKASFVKAKHISDTETEVTMTHFMSGDHVTRILPTEHDHFLRQFQQFQRGQLIQNAFPELDDSDREFLLTGMSDGEWDQMHEPREEEDYSDVEGDEPAF